MYVHDICNCGVTLPATNRTNGRLSSIVGTAKSGVIVVAVDGHLLTETSVVGTVINKLGVTCGGGDASAVASGMNSTC